MTVVWIIVGIAVIAFVATLIFSDKSDPAKRVGEAGVVAAFSAVQTIGCIMSFIWPVIGLLIGLWLLKQIFG